MSTTAPATTDTDADTGAAAERDSAARVNAEDKLRAALHAEPASTSKERIRIRVSTGAAEHKR